MKYINQLDYEHLPYVTCTEATGEKFERGQKTTIRSSGCGLCSAIMVAHRLLPNIEFGLDEALAISYESKANYGAGTGYQRFVPAFAQRVGLYYESSDDPQDLIRCLQTGGAAVVHVGGDQEGRVGVFSHIGHYIVAINVERDGRIAILDPSYKIGKYEEEGRVGKVEMKNDYIALTDVETLVKDSSNRHPSFWLFWRE